MVFCLRFGHFLLCPYSSFLSRHTVTFLCLCRNCEFLCSPRLKFFFGRASSPALRSSFSSNALFLLKRAFFLNSFYFLISRTFFPDFPYHLLERVFFLNLLCHLLNRIFFLHLFYYLLRRITFLSGAVTAIFKCIRTGCRLIRCCNAS